MRDFDAAGKATQTALLVARLRAAGIEADSMSFPNYKTATGKLILKMLKGTHALCCGGQPGAAGRFRCDVADNALALQSLMTANRYEQYEKLAEWSNKVSSNNPMAHSRDVPAVLVLDRYWLSGLVYGMADGLDRAWLLAVHAALPPAHHIFIDVPAEEALRRRLEARDRFERDREKQARVLKNYRAEWQRAMLDEDVGPLRRRVWRVDGAAAPAAVEARVWTIVETTDPDRVRLFRGGA